MAPSRITTVGRMLLEKTLPPDLLPEKPLDKKELARILTIAAEKSPDKYVDLVKNLADLGRETSTLHGRQTGAGIADLTPPPEVEEMRARIRAHVKTVTQDPKIPWEEKNKRIVDYLTGLSSQFREQTMESAASHGNAIALAAKHGFRGNALLTTQLLAGDLLVTDHKGRPIPVPGLHGYAEGTTPMEYFAGSYGSRKGYWDQQYATAQTGFFGKQLAYAAQRLRVTGDDCGTQNGIPVEGRDPDNIGAVLANDVGDLKAGHTITKHDLPKLEDKEIMVRSHITCRQPAGVCKLCSGRRENGRFPTLGAYVGISSARTASEPLTQLLALASKHQGGTVGVQNQQVGGFESLKQFFNVPERFVGAASLAPEDGIVQNVRKAPQGGQFVTVNKTDVYVPDGLAVQVKKGDSVEAGDSLSDGLPNPREIVKYKGLGEGRVYFARKFRNLLQANGINMHRRHTETLSRAFLDRVRLLDDGAMENHRPGELVPYSDFQAAYKARPDAGMVETDRAQGRYLEQPVLHYTIGTRVVPSMVKRLKDAGISQVLTHSEPPGFEPEVFRIMDIPGSDPDWKVRMSGFYLQKNFLDAATHGSVSSPDSTAYVPALMDPTLLSERSDDE